MKLAQRSARAIVRAVVSGAQRWGDADFPPRVRVAQTIVQRTGYSIPVVEYALDRLFSSVTEPALIAAIEDELGSLAALDGFAPRRGRPDAWARPAGTAGVIASRTTVGVAIPPAIFALCAKCDVIVKDREDALTAAFFETLTEELPEFAHAARAHPWRSDEGSDGFERFDVLVAFGRDETLQSIRNALPAGCRFVGFGSRAGRRYVTRETLDDPQTARAVAEGAARDLVLYDTEGCLSLHVLFVERAPGLDAFCAALARAVERAAIEFPIGTREPVAAAALAQCRDLGAFRAAAGTGAVFSNANCDYVLLREPLDSPPPFLPRALAILPVDGPDDAAEYLRTHRIALEGFALSDERADLLEAAVATGTARLARFGELQQPPLSGNHGGRPRIADFVSWVERSL